MYTYSRLGKNGRLGNQMFQYATLFALGDAANCEIAIPANVRGTEVYQGNERSLSILDVFPNLSAKQSATFSYNGRYEEPEFMFSPNVFLLRPNCDIHGYFQSSRYFTFCEEKIRKEYTFVSHVAAVSDDKIAGIKEAKKKSICSLHVRRGDYVGLSNFHTNLVTTDYYSQAIGYMTSTHGDMTFVVFSDDIEWCKEAISFGNDLDVIFSPGSSESEDMCIMSKCDYHIIANSSFSWWGAWLADSKQVIAPKIWFGPDGPKEWGSIYCEGWGIL